MPSLSLCGFLATVPLLASSADDPLPVKVGLSAYKASCQVKAEVRDDQLLVTWPSAEGESGWMILRLRPGKSLIAGLGAIDAKAPDRVVTVEDADPVARVTVGSREASKGRPPGMSPFNEFFDNPHTRPSTQHESQFALKSMALDGQGDRLSIDVGDVEIGPFRGLWRHTFFAGSRLVMVEAVVKTDRDRVAFLYDAGLASPDFRDGRVAWTGTGGAPISYPAGEAEPPGAIAVRHRALAYELEGRSVVFTPPPHQYFFPRDFTNNVHTGWHGKLADGRGVLGVRQDATGGGNYVPWFNAPPGTEQHLKLFLHVSHASARAGLDQMLEYTRRDRFADMPGRVTFTSHYHMAIAAAAMKRAAKGEPPETDPDYVRMFKDMNVQAVHLGEFHGDGHQYDPGPLRLPEMKAMFDECRQLSGDKLLLIPGEEFSKFLGIAKEGQQPGHWMSLFPKPVYWIHDRKTDQPFVEDDPKYGKVYRVGSVEDVQKVLGTEHGLAWSAHPRIKASAWAPDAFFGEPYFKADTFLGGAWKAMPADLSHEKLGRRGLDLLDDMLNLGARKFLPGEVDVFTLDYTHELYGHMNINYLKLDKLPTFDGGWQSILDALRGGTFFTTTGEVLIEDFMINGARSGGEANLWADQDVKFWMKLKWTYPLAAMEMISGDGQKVFRHRRDLSETRAFEGKVFEGIYEELRGRKWVRIEVYDVAGNTAYSQPIWLTERK